ncbi:phosphoglycolate phosphatase [Denitromonas ohlonensis]|uniref:Phosphoglycolate phosphatase n=2 Tax=Denitromonas TaxID=139331 RepID=A0A557SFD0_9RHOO|nr:phosphoglycolate phosphatase [Denitromonas ohlonensis]TVO64193.1 phosphoglycolate phosphatase [Denitromonas ohlonensis]TVO76094.1 phosphoglycolate phosphatase [Denitromonas ohlonensis]
MTRQFAVDALLFDLDGTLVDSIGDLALAANAMLAELGRPARSLEAIRCFVGKGIPKLVERCLADAPLTGAAFDAAVEVFKRHYAQTNGQVSQAYPGVVDMLTTLRAQGISMACVTNKATAFTEPLLQLAGIASFFDAVVCGDTLDVKKPHPGMLLHACEQLGVDIAHVLMIGDSANDAESARAAGCPVLLMTWGYTEGVPVDTIECDGLLSSANALLQRVAPRAP